MTFPNWFTRCLFYTLNTTNCDNDSCRYLLHIILCPCFLNFCFFPFFPFHPVLGNWALMSLNWSSLYCLSLHQAEELCPRHRTATPRWHGGGIGANRGSMPRGAVRPCARPRIPHRYETIFHTLAHSCEKALLSPVCWKSSSIKQRSKITNKTSHRN